MEILSPASYFSSSIMLTDDSRFGGASWTAAENKQFENALAMFDKDTPERWHNVAAMIPGRTVGEVMRKYKELENDVNDIEAGLIPLPGYTNSPFTLDWVNGHGCDGFARQSYVLAGKRSASARPTEQERKKGVPWTEDEHKLFLMGLKKYGKGDWRNISRNYVVTRTPTQVASHAQKYFIRQLSGGKDKRRASIHDITTVNPSDVRTPSPEGKRVASPELQEVGQSQPSSRAPFQWNQQSHGGLNMSFQMNYGNGFVANPYGIKMQGVGHHHGSYLGPQSLALPMPSAQRYSSG